MALYQIISYGCHIKFITKNRFIQEFCGFSRIKIVATRILKT